MKSLELFIKLSLTRNENIKLIELKIIKIKLLKLLVFNR